MSQSLHQERFYICWKSKGDMPYHSLKKRHALPSFIMQHGTGPELLDGPIRVHVIVGKHLDIIFQHRRENA